MIKIRMATLNDSEALLNIYAPYVEKTAISFEYEVPTKDDFTKRIEKILMKYPYLVALNNGEIVGYAYASSFHERAAYNWSVEVSIYIKEDAKKMGIGKQLYRELEAILIKQNIVNVNACISYPNDPSIAFHEKLGFKTIAHFHKSGYKFNTWYDMIWMEKAIAKHNEPKRFIPINDLFSTI